jgi:hypothetical protein
LWGGKSKWLYQSILAFPYSNPSFQANGRADLKETLPIPPILSGREIGHRIIVTLNGRTLNEYKGNTDILEELNFEYLVEVDGSVCIINKPWAGRLRN